MKHNLNPARRRIASQESFVMRILSSESDSLILSFADAREDPSIFRFYIGYVDRARVGNALSIGETGEDSTTTKHCFAPATSNIISVKHSTCTRSWQDNNPVNSRGEKKTERTLSIKLDFLIECPCLYRNPRTFLSKWYVTRDTLPARKKVVQIDGLHIAAINSLVKLDAPSERKGTIGFYNCTRLSDRNRSFSINIK
jgi:hypothetical protein